MMSENPRSHAGFTKQTAWHGIKIRTPSVRLSVPLRKNVHSMLEMETELPAK